MDYYISKLKQYLSIFANPKVDIIAGIIMLVIAIVVSQANNTQAGTGILLAIGIVFILAGFFGLNGGMWNF